MIKNLATQNQAVIFMAIASVFFALMGMAVKLCAGLPTVQIVFFRAVIAIFLCLIQLKFSHVSPWGNQKKLLILRGLFGTAALFLFFHTLHQLPFATAVTIQYLSPIFTTLITTLFLKEVFFPKQSLFFIGAFIGILLIKGLHSPGPIWPFLIGIVSSICAACAYTTIRKIKNQDHPLVIIFYFPLVTIPLSFPFMLSHWVTPTNQQWFYLVAVGIFVQIAQYFMTRAYQIADASVVSIAGYLGVVWASLLGYFVFSETPQPIALTGMLIVVLSIIANTFYVRMKRNKLQGLA